MSSFSILAQEDSICNDTISLQIMEETTPEVLEAEEENIIEEIKINIPRYLPWEKVKIDGKLRMQGLPLSPSLKIFMEKDSLIDVSIRAPFIGEAARIVINTDSVTIVNKMNKTFFNEGITDFLKYYPAGISGIQDLLLARVFIEGDDDSKDLSELADIYYENNQFNVVPKENSKLPGIEYGYVVDEYFKPLLLIVLPSERPDIEIAALYSYPENKTKDESLIYPSFPYNIQLIYQDGDNSRELSLEFKQPEWSGEAPKELETGKKYRRLSFSEFLRSF